MEATANFVNFSTLKEFKRFPRCPDKKELLCSLASIDRNNTLLIFISHCWLRGDATQPHPDNEEGDKYQLCIKGIKKVWQVFAPRMNECFVWMDYSCMSQDVENLSNELPNYEQIMKCCDVIFTPIVDPDYASWDVTGHTDLIDMCHAKSWGEGPRAYLNRAWCRVEMMYAAHIPVLDNVGSEVRRHTMFESGLTFHCSEGRRLHALYSTKQLISDGSPWTVPPLQYQYLDDYHPLRGIMTRDSDREAIEILVKLQPYTEMKAAHFVNFSTLKEFKRFPRCPDNKELLCSLSSIDRNNALLIFISHCWLRGDGASPHPDNEEGDKYQLCIKGIEKVWKVFAPRMKDCFVWMDYCCMDQDVENLSNELSNYDKIVECCDVIFTPIVDPDHASWKVTAYKELKDICLAKSWKDGPRAYLNRAWCRVEMLYAAHIPVLDNVGSEVRRHTMFESGLAYHCSEGRRLHALYSTKQLIDDGSPWTVPPLQYQFMDDYHPLKGSLTRDIDRKSLEELLIKLQPYIELNAKVEGYTGTYAQNGQKHGHGVYRHADGDVYEGNWENGLYHGHGVYRYADGAVHDGNWENDKRHGHGVKRYADGSVYDGYWENDKKHGHGVYRYANGAVYEGNWENGQMHGQGVCRFADGAVYGGNWENDKMHGHGVFRYAEGDVYEGNWENHKKHGQGVCRYADGAVYGGNWENHKKHGQGVCRYADGAVYEGNWENDKKHGIFEKKGITNRWCVVS